MKLSDYTATGKLLKIYLRNHKVMTLLVVFLPFLFAYAAAASNLVILQTPDQLATYITENQGNAMLGFIAANTIAAATIWRIRLSTAIIIAVLSVIMIINNTRRDEELGRLELLRAGVVGKNAPLTALLLKVFGANILGGLMMALGFLAVGFAPAGSFVAGLATACCSCAIAAGAAIAAQIAPNARLARGLSFGLVAFFFGWQMVANALDNQLLLLLTPFGWCAVARPYAGEDYRLFAFAVPVIMLLTVSAVCLSNHRDLGGSYLRERRGRTTARKYLGSSLALAWRQERGLVLIWGGTYLIMGLIIASLVPNINKMLAGTSFLPALSTALGGAGNAFLAILAYILTQVVTAFAIIVLLRLREEESLNRAELILTSGATRNRYLSAYLLIAFAGSAVAIAIFGFCSGNFVAICPRIPAVWLVASVTVLLLGIAPRLAAPLSWGLFGVLLLLEFLWELRVVGNGLFALSPFAWVYPGVPISVLPLLLMIIATIGLIMLGRFFYLQRDILAE